MTERNAVLALQDEHGTWRAECPFYADSEDMISLPLDSMPYKHEEIVFFGTNITKVCKLHQGHNWGGFAWIDERDCPYTHREESTAS